MGERPWDSNLGMGHKGQETFNFGMGHKGQKTFFPHAGLGSADLAILKGNAEVLWWLLD